ncbi:MAG: hypothetical protein WBN72_08970, partial [Nitrososphaeraceae archaeon]
PKAVEVVLQPVASKLNNNTIQILANDISKKFENKTSDSVGTIVDPHSEPQFKSASELNRNPMDFEIIRVVI